MRSSSSRRDNTCKHLTLTISLWRVRDDTIEAKKREPSSLINSSTLLSHIVIYRQHTHTPCRRIIGQIRNRPRSPSPSLVKKTFVQRDNTSPVTAHWFAVEEVFDMEERGKKALSLSPEHLLSRTTITTIDTLFRLQSLSLFLSGESDVINIKMSLVDFQLFLLLPREKKDASSSSSSRNDIRNV